MFKPFNLIMISAEFEHGGNLMHRHFDGHPRCFTYMGESQMGTKYSRNALTYWHPFRYAYPEFPEGTTYERAFDLMWDEECKAYLRNPARSKFKDCGLVMDESKRRAAFRRHCSYEPLIEHGALLGFSRAQVVEAYFRSFFDAWENLNRSGRETHHIGYVPGMVAETDKLFADFPNAHIIHVVRNPFSAYADYLRRPYPQQTLEEYCAVYNAAHHMAVNYAVKYENFHLIRLEDFLADKRAALGPIVDQIGIGWDDALSYPSFNSKVLETLPPWGTVQKPTVEYNASQASSLTLDTRVAIFKECALLNDVFGYNEFAGLNA
jgi:hypothetical protein